MRIKFFSTRAAALAAVAAGALALSACAVTPTPYQPQSAGNQVRGGFSDEQIEANRFAVRFAGNSYTSRETVERYLLYRAAQLTVERGFDNFVLVDRNTDRRTQTYIDRPYGAFGTGFGYGGYGGFGGYWSPSWRYYGGGFGWRSWSPFYGDPFFDRTIDVRTVERYEAFAEIVTGRGPKPAGNVRAFDAREVLQNLGPSVNAPPM